jgi:hypothetical protein
MRFLIIFLISSLMMFSSCKNDFDINDEWKDITIVYGILNSSQTTHYLRVQKAYLGDGNAYDMAAISDSILYQQNLNIYMEEWKNGVLKKTFNFNDKVFIPKDSGLFAYDNHYVFKTTGVLDPAAEYRIFIEKEGQPTVASSTGLLSSFIIKNPPMYQPLPVSFHSSNAYDLEWESCAGGKVYNVEIDFTYWEITATDTIARKLNWNGLSSVTAPTLAAGQKLTLGVTGSSFLSFVNSKIIDDPAVIKRVAKQKGIDFHFYVGDENLYTYMQLTAPSSGLIQDKPSYTNIENGVGLFASRYNQSITGRTLSDRTLDSLASGIYTKTLKFMTSGETIQYWSQYGE